ncbi:sigma 54-interacting transcriptional regulator [Pokkaliibacter sp. MBI-7]|uniref:sigma-54-dependent Fis family transcriptional regulator n=1 Tax=Pokkaliibacter sp. MBI-7 TaxID=3040600 RepID=UPI00244C05EB|nr:sigma-54-dependent Fis family transcriptional regulator [Pokkaliibacter sp. MBI-7]MDH2435843.1 sigma 54-interacting transcriptional regulator [Pokkaliibacter sp. MBI-7]
MTNPGRISLADLSRLDAGVLLRGNSSQLDYQHSPTLEELTECLCFSPGDGRIWLNDQRMLLIHASSLGTLRRELIDTLGIEAARGLLTRTGYVSGTRDAQLVRQRWPDADPASIFGAGTQLHGLEGVVKVEPVHFEFDTEQGRYEGEFIWHHSSEDDEHIAAYGIGTDPACWLELGYAIGYVSGLVGRLVLFREVECRSMGSRQCRVLGKTAELWPDAEEDLRYLNPQGYASPAVISAEQSTVVATTAEADNSVKMIGASAAFTAASHALQKVAGTQATVLLTGESGVGKELFATMLHRLSPRSQQPFVAFNCAAIPENLLESELFGVERGAFTGATHSRAGRFERAHGGTLFLDEIGTLSAAGQSKLLRALQEREVERIGGSRAIKVDVRVVAATNEDLRDAVKRGEFREDLFYRLNVFPIPLPPLRERRDDIPLLVSHFFQHYCQLHGRQLRGMTQKATQALLNYDFPGNIRELQNLIERGVIAADEGGLVDIPHLFRNEKIPQSMIFSVNRQGALSNKPQTSAASLWEQLQQLAGDELSMEQLEQRLLQEAVTQADGNLAAAARQLGLSRAQLAYRLKKS